MRIQTLLIHLFIGFVLNSNLLAAVQCVNLFMNERRQLDQAQARNQFQIEKLTHFELFQRILEVTREFRKHIKEIDSHPEDLADDVPMLLRLAEKAWSSHLTEHLIVQDREQFDFTIVDIEQMVIAQLQKAIRGSNSLRAVDSIRVLSAAAKHMAPRLGDSVRVEVGKFLIEELVRSPELMTEIFGILKIWRYKPSEAEVVLIMRILYREWRVSTDNYDSAMQNFSRLPHFIHGLPATILQPFIATAKKWLQSEPAKLKKNYVGFLWALLELNPGVANQFAISTEALGAVRLPLTQNPHLQQVRSTQLNFINNYFRKVLKRSVKWLIEEERRFGKVVILETRPTIYQRKLLEALKTQGFTAVVEYQVPSTNIVVDLIIAQIGSRGRIIEVDGEIHYMVDESYSKILHPLDSRRDELLRAMGYSVQRMTNIAARFEAERIRTSSGQDSKF